MSTTNKNLAPAAFLWDIDLSKENAVEAVEKLGKLADEECCKAIEWYFSHKKAKQYAGMWLRMLGILAVAAAGVIPILGEIFEKENSKPAINPAWATIALAVAALFIAMDRFGGCMRRPDPLRSHRHGPLPPPNRLPH